MNIKIFKTRKEFKKYANDWIDDNFWCIKNFSVFWSNPNIPYVAYARYIEKTIHGEDASEVKGFKPSQNQRITDRLQEKLIKLLTKDAEEIVLTNDLSQVHLIAEKHDGNLQVAINRLIDSSASYLEAHEKKHIDPNNNVWLYINNHEVYLSKRQTIKINQAIQDKLDEYWAENPTEDEKEATRAERLWEMNEGR